jgi:hypothetical protein
MTALACKREIERFLVRAEPDVLCISGKWGVGKIFAWKKYLLEARDKNDGIALKQIALDEVRAQPARRLHHLDAFEALQDLLPHHLQLHLGQPVADAAVDAEAEGHVLARPFAPDEPVGVGYRSHLDRRHWISVSLDADVPTSEIGRLAARSYDLVAADLTKKQKAELAAVTA